METLTILGVILLAVIVYFIYQLLQSIQSSLRKLDMVLWEIDTKLKKLSSLVNSVENISDIVEKETEALKSEYQCNRRDRTTPDSEEMASWVISSIKLGLKIFKKRR